MTDHDALLKSAIVKVRAKVAPKGLNTDILSTPPQPYEQLYPLLDVWDSNRIDPDIQKQVQFIYDFLEKIRGDEGHRDMVMHILTKLGPSQQGQARLDRVYKYCRLQSKSQSLMREFEVLQGELNALGNSRR